MSVINEQVNLCIKNIGSIDGEFQVKSYQRGYRWGEADVMRLLNDIFSGNLQNDYFLQPIVISKIKGKKNEYELIDGQQRLTTIYLIYKCLCGVYRLTEDCRVKFSIEYETRKKLGENLKNIDNVLNDNFKNTSIDFWFMNKAYETIKEWFKNNTPSLEYAIGYLKYLNEHVKVIWYQVGENENSNELFIRLNIGKILLTNAELVKAMFLNKNGINSQNQEEIAFLWDSMERELSDDSFWYFLTSNSYSDSYQTRIDLILNLMARNNGVSRDRYYTFFEFDKMRKNKELKEIWNDILECFYILKGWYENRLFYHKIGYLIRTNTLSLQKIYDLFNGITKDEFIDILNAEIKKSISKIDYGKLSYEKPNEKNKIFNLLLLFNIESIQQLGDDSQRFPFEKFRKMKNSSFWSLEHIHAQQSESLIKKEAWVEWLEEHKKSLMNISNKDNKELDELIDEINSLDFKKITKDTFLELYKRITSFLSDSKNNRDIHSISNLALLNSNNNSALKNSTFDVKRNKIIEMDKNGEYIPYCTKMVFLKYYTNSFDNQIHFWGDTDRESYLKAINETIRKSIDSEFNIVEGE